ncbi:putative Glucosamine-6-phosphate deaminase [Giardia muris]|uniref:N-acetylglucosaminylphosphatidylinositol deacetylase n=1 Tax=Giardia muris TaxID=5742 RepID=A0A4Z1SSP7_GIAMU|nr:putative Glucosamine-6-phosphate deaminase [Giardia muris]|eukprot:TNJ28015.1 putative Glucosamine-6-phosphate deaminase [Giardia muris]
MSIEFTPGGHPVIVLPTQDDIVETLVEEIGKAIASTGRQKVTISFWADVISFEVLRRVLLKHTEISFDLLVLGDAPGLELAISSAMTSATLHQDTTSEKLPPYEFHMLSNEKRMMADVLFLTPHNKTFGFGLVIAKAEEQPTTFKKSSLLKGVDWDHVTPLLYENVPQATKTLVAISGETYVEAAERILRHSEGLMGRFLLDRKPSVWIDLLASRTFATEIAEKLPDLNGVSTRRRILSLQLKPIKDAFFLKNLETKLTPIAEPWIPHDGTVLMFSPHPDDDVISAGLALEHVILKRCDEVHVAYCVPGFSAVRDELASKDESTPLSRRKAIVREEEARDALTRLGFYDNQKNEEVFLQLPFYGDEVRPRRMPSIEDTRIVMAFIQEHSPHTIFLAGDLSDPHRTHSACYDVIRAALLQLYEHVYVKLRTDKSVLEKIGDMIKKYPSFSSSSEYQSSSSVELAKSCLYSPLDFINASLSVPRDAPYAAQAAILEVLGEKVPVLWMYRGAWNEFRLHEVSAIVLAGKDEVARKLDAIRAHRSQMGDAVVLGEDSRSFDQRAEERLATAAQSLRDAGLLLSDAVCGAEFYSGGLLIP